MDSRTDSRITFIAYAQAIAIIMVVLMHSLHMYAGPINLEAEVMRVLWPIVMALFVFVSGFLLAYTTWLAGRMPGWGAFVARKARRLLLPYAVLSLVAFVPRTMMSGIADNAVELSWRGLLNGLLNEKMLIIPYFWFLIMLFVLIVGTYSVVTLMHKARMGRRTILLVLASTVIVLLLTFTADYPWLAINQVLNYGLYFVMGIAYAHVFRWFDSRRAASSWLLGAAMVIGGTAIYLAGNHIALIIIGITMGVAGWITITRWLERVRPRLLDALSPATYVIFLLSWFVNVATQQVMAHILTLPWWVYSVMSLTMGIYVPWVIWRWLNRHRDSRIASVLRTILGS